MIMKNDVKIRILINKIKRDCEDYIDYVNAYNECAYSDRKIEYIISHIKLLEELHNEKFDIIKKDKKEKVR